MKKVLIIFLTMLSVLITNNTLFEDAEKENSKESISKYETWGSDLTDEELMQYYIDNEIKPANAPSGSGGKLVKSGVSTHLTGRFPKYTDWNVSDNKGFVKDVYGDNPIEINEHDEYIQEAKTLAEIDYNAIGCGPLAKFK